MSLPPSLTIAVNERTTPAEALRLAHACGYACFAAGGNELAFVLELTEKINVRYSRHPLVRFLRTGFTAGYFNRPLPDIERILIGCAAREDRLRNRGRVGRPRKGDARSAANNNESCAGDAFDQADQAH